MRHKLWISVGALLGLTGCVPAQWKESRQNAHTCMGQAQVVGSLHDARLNEVSGLAASTTHPGCLWVHNDSGDGDFLYLIDSLGHTRGQFKLGRFQQRDWEDLAMGPGPKKGVGYVYVGEIGDNDQVLRYISIYRVAEPTDLPPGGMVQQLIGVDTLLVKYADGPRDCEALMVDPQTRDIYLISKRDNPSRLYRLAYPQRTDTYNVAQPVLALPYTQVTAADISPDGRWIAVKNYDSLWIYRRDSSQSVTAALSGKACAAPYVREAQGEAVAWQRHTKGVFTTSERRRSISLAPAVYYYPLQAPH